MNKFLIIIFLISIFNNNFAQKDVEIPETVITSSRIDLPFSENSHTISIISSTEIAHSTANNVADLLQQEVGIDVRRRGIDGMQSDIYIRGGGFDQVLILIDGIKTDNPQTGHHTMNMMIPLENIERIEIIKGPAARIFGQNAFTGAINIVTKQAVKSNLTLQVGAGSFGRLNGEITGSLNLKKVSFIAHYSKNYSKGYRFNTDFDNDNFFLKTSIKTKYKPINVLATFSQRKFGANGFYASPAFKDQYEETQTSLIGISTVFKVGILYLKPKIYWKRNQDNYFFLRHKPSFYENFHISNKIGAELNTKFKTIIGTTGAGLEVTRTFLSSNNLGERNRTTANLFLEHRIELLKGKLDITPGVALSYYTDFNFQALPGLDIGFRLYKHFRFYGNIGYTYRIPTYTDLYYASPSTLGNENLKPEKALAEELGAAFKNKHFDISIAGFNRDASNLIDYTKNLETDKFQANNIRKVNTKGVEANFEYKMTLLKLPQKIKIGYTFMYDDIQAIDFNYSRYVLNSTKHHFSSSLDFSFMKGVKHFIAYKYVERADGTSYNVYDAKLSFTIKSFELSGVINNIFDTQYSETNLVPMAGRNFMIGIRYVLE